MLRKPVIAVVGSGSAEGRTLEDAREIGRLIAENGWVLITGGRDAGVMRAASEGSKQAKESLAIGILPNRETRIADAVDVAIITDTGEARNNIIVLSADAVVACGIDDPGTASEVALALKNEKPVVLLGVSESGRAFFSEIGRGHVHTADSPADAVGLLKSMTPSRQ